MQWNLKCRKYVRFHHNNIDILIKYRQVIIQNYKVKILKFKILSQNLFFRQIYRLTNDWQPWTYSFALLRSLFLASRPDHAATTTLCAPRTLECQASITNFSFDRLLFYRDGFFCEFIRRPCGRYVIIALIITTNRKTDRELHLICR